MLKTPANASEPAIGIAPNQNQTETPKSVEKTTVLLPMNHLAMTFESNMSKAILLLRSTNFLHNAETFGSDEKTTVLLRYHIQQMAASESKMNTRKATPSNDALPNGSSVRVKYENKSIWTTKHLQQAMPSECKQMNKIAVLLAS